MVILSGEQSQRRGVPGQGRDRADANAVAPETTLNCGVARSNVEGLDLAGSERASTGNQRARPLQGRHKNGAKP